MCVSDDLDVHLPGSTSVATEALLEQADQLARLEYLLRSVDVTVATVTALVHESHGSIFERPRGLDELTLVASRVNDARHMASQLSSALSSASQTYGQAEHEAQQLSDMVAGVIGTILGQSASRALDVLGPFAWLLPALLQQQPSDGQATSRDIHIPADVNRTLADPATVDAIRAGVTGIDDFFRELGNLSVPLGDALGTGDDEAGQATAAAMAVLLTGQLFGMFGDTPTAATKTRTVHSSQSPTTIEGLIRGIPGNEEGQQPGNFRIDTITKPDGSTAAIVYIGGTEDFNPVPNTAALDMTSNVEGIAQMPTGSMRALEQAMADSGVTSSTPVVFVGYSQGGLLASAATASGSYSVAGLVTIGNPAGNIATPSDVPAVLIAHDEDLVTALGGNQTNDNALRITRRLFDSPQQIPADLAVPGHRLPYYLQTAALVDDATSAEVSTMVDKVTSISAGATSVESRWYDAYRLPSSGSQAAQG